MIIGIIEIWMRNLNIDNNIDISIHTYTCKYDWNEVSNDSI